jgi:hypothetical protein
MKMEDATDLSQDSLRNDADWPKQLHETQLKGGGTLRLQSEYVYLTLLTMPR